MIILLDDSPAATVAAWAQVGLGISTLIVAIVALTTTKKIQELVDLTEAIGNQTQELAKQTGELVTQTKVATLQYELEKTSSLHRRIPVFALIPRSRVTNPLRLEFRNDGVAATEVSLTQQGSHYTLEISDTNVAENGLLTVSISGEIENIGFRINSKSELGKAGYQDISKVSGSNFRISPPTEI